MRAALVLLLLAGPKDECARMEVGDVVRILAAFEVKQAWLPAIGDRELYGVTHYRRREIVINARFEESVRRLTVLHELFHARHDEESRSQDDALIRACAVRAYKRLYGGDQGLPEQFREAHLPDWR